MSLIATARALDDTRFSWRVRAALLRIAAIRRDSELTEEVMYATHLLNNPMTETPSLTAMCAVDSGVTEKIEVDDLNMVNTEGVLDDTLIYIAEVNFGRLAAEYCSDLMSAPSAPTMLTSADQTTYYPNKVAR